MTACELMPAWIEELAPRQRELVRVIYERGGATIQEIHALIPDPPRTSCGIKTLLGRMVRKGVLRTRRSGRHSELFYLPAVSTPDVVSRAFDRLAIEHFRGSSARALNALCRLADREALAEPCKFDFGTEFKVEMLPGRQAFIMRGLTKRSFPRHFHDVHGIGVMLSGAQRSRSDRGVVEAEPGDVIMVNPGEVHDGRPIARGPTRWDMLYIAPELIESIAAEHGWQGQAEFTEPVVRDVRLAARLRSLASPDREVTAAHEQLKTDQELILILGQTLRPASRPQEPAPVKAALELMDSDIGAAIKLDDLASSCGLSRFHFIRAFTQAKGVTPHAYLMQRRCQVALGLIAAGTSIAMAAAETGFSDQSHLTRLLTRFYGLTPGAMKRAAAGTPRPMATLAVAA